MHYYITILRFIIFNHEVFDKTLLLWICAIIIIVRSYNNYAISLKFKIQNHHKIRVSKLKAIQDLQFSIVPPSKFHLSPVAWPWLNDYTRLDMEEIHPISSHLFYRVAVIVVFLPLMGKHVARPEKIETRSRDAFSFHGTLASRTYIAAAVDSIVSIGQPWPDRTTLKKEFLLAARQSLSFFFLLFFLFTAAPTFHVLFSRS